MIRRYLRHEVLRPIFPHSIFGFMQSFRYLRPAPEERRAQIVQGCGMAIGVIALGIAARFSHDDSLRAMIYGLMLATIFLGVRSYSAFEAKRRRAERQEITIDDSGICFVDRDAEDRFVAWRDIETCEVRGGKLRLEWPDEAKTSHREISAREVENGVPLIEAIAGRWNTAHGRAQKLIIPLLPR